MLETDNVCSVPFSCRNPVLCLVSPCTASAGDGAPTDALPGTVVPGAQGGLNAFVTLLLIKALCEDKLCAAVQRQVTGLWTPSVPL
jgi:hypothetical protein